jgi:RimJ/RimL family protein N-acetyltransferase
MKFTQRLPVLSSLYTPREPVLNKEIIYCKHFALHHLVLRPLSITTDLPFIYQWAWPMSHAQGMIAASYLYTRESNFARSFMALRNNITPVGQIDICGAAQDEIDEDYKTMPGDYILRIIINPHEKRGGALYQELLRLCIEYFFLLPEVKRLLIETDIEDVFYSKIVKKTGFTFDRAICLNYKMVNLYYCTRESFTS